MKRTEITIYLAIFFVFNIKITDPIFDIILVWNPFKAIGSVPKRLYGFVNQRFDLCLTWAVIRDAPL